MEKKLNLTYTEKDGLMYPNIESSVAEFGRFGRDWLNNLHKNHRQRFITLRMTGKLEQTAQAVDREAIAKQEFLYQQMLAVNPMPQSEDILERTRHLNSLRLTAVEIVMRETVMRPR